MPIVAARQAREACPAPFAGIILAPPRGQAGMADRLIRSQRRRRGQRPGGLRLHGSCDLGIIVVARPVLPLICLGRGAMRCLALCVVALTIEFPGADSRAAEPAQQPPYTFTINGLPFTPRVFSLRDDPEHPAPGDLIAMGTMLLTLGLDRDCRFIIASENENKWKFDKVFLRLSDGRKRLVACVIHSSEAGPEKCRDQSAAKAFGRRDSRVVGHLSRCLAEGHGPTTPADRSRAGMHYHHRPRPDPAERKADLPAVAGGHSAYLPAVAGGHSISQYRGRVRKR